MTARRLELDGENTSGDQNHPIVALASAHHRVPRTPKSMIIGIGVTAMEKISIEGRRVAAGIDNSSSHGRQTLKAPARPGFRGSR